MAELRVALKLTADASGLNTEVNKAKVSIDSLARDSLDAGESLKRSLGTSGREAGEALRQGLSGAGAANDDLTGKTKLTTQQLLALQYTASDVAASLASGASPFTVLMQQGGQLLQAFPGIAGRVLGIGAAIGLVAAPLAIVGSRVADISKETRELSAVLKAMGDQAGVSGEQLRLLSAEAIKAGATREESYQAALALARNPTVRGADMFRDLLNLAPDVASVLGITIPSAAEKMGDAFRAGAEGVRKLDEELNFLAPEQELQLRQLEMTNNRAGAARLAIEALKEKYAGTAKSMKGDWASAMSDARLAWDEYIEHIANSDLAKLVSAKVSGAAKAVRFSMAQARGDDEAARLRDELTRIDREYAQLPEKTSGVSATHEALIVRRIELMQKLKALTESINADSGSASPLSALSSNDVDLKSLAKVLNDVAGSIGLVTARYEFPDCNLVREYFDYLIQEVLP